MEEKFSNVVFQHNKPSTNLLSTLYQPSIPDCILNNTEVDEEVSKSVTFLSWYLTYPPSQMIQISIVDSTNTNVDQS